MSTEQIIIEANLTYDEAGNRPLPRLIWPFPNLVAAYEYIGSLGPVWGEWTTAPVLVPEPMPWVASGVNESPSQPYVWQGEPSAHDDGCEADWGPEGQESPCRCAERAQGQASDSCRHDDFASQSIGSGMVRMTCHDCGETTTNGVHDEQP